MSSKINLKRAYEPATPADGFRIYIDRLWPRGLSHETFHYDLWDKELAPSTELREWFHADPDGRWPEFRQRYGDELRGSQALTDLIAIVSRHPVVTLLYSSRDEHHNNAIIVRDLLLP